MSRLWILPALALIATPAVACSNDTEVVTTGLAGTSGSLAPDGQTFLDGLRSAHLRAVPDGFRHVDVHRPDLRLLLYYPAAWYLSPPKDNGGYLMLYSYDPASAVDDGRPVPPDKVKVSTWIAEGVDKPIEQWLDEERTGPGVITPVTLVSRSNSTFGGRSWEVEVVEAEDVQTVGYYFSLGGGRVFALDAVPADSKLMPELESLIASLRLPQ